MRIVELSPDPQSGARLVGYLHDKNPEAPGREPRPAVIVCPGGGYQKLAPKEADVPALSFFSRGYQVFTLWYSVWSEGEKPLGIQPLKELSLAVMAVRDRHEEWSLDPDRLAVCGFSAGGHLCGSAGILWDMPELKQAVDTRNGYNRPNAMILSYPVVTGGPYAHRGSFQALTGRPGEHPQSQDRFSLEKHVDEKTCPAFLWHTFEDNTVPLENALLLAAALRQNVVPFELHIFPKGKHGLCLSNEESGPREDGCEAWFPLCLNWLGRLFQFRP